jgi:1-acyl-sn-glycerol-3-phosphate acyltransferase
MLFLRSLIFNIFFPVWTFSLAAIGMPLLLLPRKIMAHIGYVWASGVMLGLKLICGIKYEIRGTENLPLEPFVIACKHQSSWETAIFLKVLNQPAYILKKELLSLPFFGRFLTGMEMIPVDREGGSGSLKKLQKDVNDRLAQKRSIIIFPEGTRTPPNEPSTYQPGIAFIYLDLPEDIPVIPVALNSGVYWNNKVFLRPAGTIIMEYLAPLPKGLNRKEFMKELKEKVDGKSRELGTLEP